MVLYEQVSMKEKWLLYIACIIFVGNVIRFHSTQILIVICQNVPVIASFTSCNLYVVAPNRKAFFQTHIVHDINGLNNNNNLFEPIHVS